MRKVYAKKKDEADRQVQELQLKVNRLQAQLMDVQA